MCTGELVRFLIPLLVIFLVSPAKTEPGQCNSRTEPGCASEASKQKTPNVNVTNTGVYLGNHDKRRQIRDWDIFRPPSCSADKIPIKLSNAFAQLDKARSEIIEIGKTRKDDHLKHVVRDFKAFIRDNPDMNSLVRLWARYGLAVAVNFNVALYDHSARGFDQLDEAYSALCDNFKEVPMGDGYQGIQQTFFTACRHYASVLDNRGRGGQELELVDKSIEALKLLDKVFGSDLDRHAEVLRDLAHILRNQGKLDAAKAIFWELLEIDPNDGFASASLGWILSSTEFNYKAGADLLANGVLSDQPGTQDSEFYYHAGYSLNRLGRHEEARKIHLEAVSRGIFPSELQRPVHMMVDLRAQPIWSVDETSHGDVLRLLEEHWEVIRDEGLANIDSAKMAFLTEGEQLHTAGSWKEMKLFSTGQRIEQNCRRAPVTCLMFEENFPDSTKCVKGEVKFSLMAPGTQVAPHCGPFNIRLRAHLGLVVPSDVGMRVATETLTWTEGKVVVIDDSFEHEVWHNGTSLRLILVVDFWHPDLNERQKKALSLQPH